MLNFFLQPLREHCRVQPSLNTLSSLVFLIYSRLSFLHVNFQERSKETVPMARTSYSFKMTVQMPNTGWTYALKNVVLVHDDGTDS